MTILEALNWVTVNGNKFAQSYAEVAVHMWSDWDVDAKRTQLLYVLSNMSYNHHAGVVEAKTAIREYLEETK